MDRRRFAATLAANGCKRRLCASKTRLAGTANTAAGRCAWTQAPAGFESWRNVSTKFQVLQFNLWQARPTRMRRPNTHTHTQTALPIFHAPSPCLFSSWSDEGTAARQSTAPSPSKTERQLSDDCSLEDNGPTRAKTIQRPHLFLKTLCAMAVN